MPIFEYVCRRCNVVFEKLVMSTADPIRCSRCNSDAVDKLISKFSSPGARTEQLSSGCGCTPQSCGCR